MGRVMSSNASVGLFHRSSSAAWNSGASRSKVASCSSSVAGAVWRVLLLPLRSGCRLRPGRRVTSGRIDTLNVGSADISVVSPRRIVRWPNDEAIVRARWCCRPAASGRDQRSVRICAPCPSTAGTCQARPHSEQSPRAPARPAVGRLSGLEAVGSLVGAVRRFHLPSLSTRGNAIGMRGLCSC